MHGDQFGWSFASAGLEITGGGRTLAETRQAATHAARRYFTLAQGRNVGVDEAATLVAHFVKVAF